MHRVLGLILVLLFGLPVPPPARPSPARPVQSTGIASSGSHPVSAVARGQEPPGLSISDTSVVEGDAGTTSAILVVTLTEPSNEDISFTFQTEEGTATADVDFQSGGGTQTIPADETSVTVTVSVLGDTVPEPTESFSVRIVSAPDVEILDDRGEVFIADDDPGVSVGNSSVVEGDSETKTAFIGVFITESRDEDVVVTYQTHDATAVAGLDYEAAQGEVTIPAGDTLVPVQLTILGDTVGELDETFTVSVDSSDAPIADGLGTVTILDDDPVVVVTVDDATSLEGDSGETTFSFPVHFSEPTPAPLDLSVRTLPGTADVDDFQHVDDTISIPVSTLTTTVTVPVHGDTRDECDETFTVNIEVIDFEDPPPLVQDGTAIGTIVNDDLLGCANVDGDCQADASCGGSDCDDGDPLTFSEAPEVNDSKDNQCPGDPGHGQVDELSGLLGFFVAGDPGRLTWSGQSGATLYDVIRGDSPAFDGTCLLESTTETGYTDTEPLDPGGVRYYLVQPAAPFPGEAGQQSDGTSRLFPCLE